MQQQRKDYYSVFGIQFSVMLNALGFVGEFRASGESVLYKGALDYGAADGIATKGGDETSAFDMVIGGLSAGTHRIVTYHNEVRDLTPTPLKIVANQSVNNRQ